MDPRRPRYRHLPTDVEVIPEDVRQVPLEAVRVLVRPSPHAVEDEVVLLVLLEIVHLFLKIKKEIFDTWKKYISSPR